jgi:hypothetical protein
MAIGKLQKERTREENFVRWWDEDWRTKRLLELKDPKIQFDPEHIKMASLMGITPEELAKTLSNAAGSTMDSSEYDALLKSCVKAAIAGDLSGMQQVHLAKLQTTRPCTNPKRLLRNEIFMLNVNRCAFFDIWSEHSFFRNKGRYKSLASHRKI